MEGGRRGGGAGGGSGGRSGPGARGGPPTCGGEHGAGEEERGGEVPVPVARGVAEHRHAIVAGLQHPAQELLELRLGQALVLLQEAPLQLAQLLAQQVLVGQLHRREDHGAEDQVEQVAEHQEAEAPGRAVPLHQAHARAAGEGLQHLLSRPAARPAPQTGPPPARSGELLRPSVPVSLQIEKTQMMWR